MTRDYEDDNLEEQVVRRGQEGYVQVFGGGRGGQLSGQQEM